MRQGDTIKSIIVVWINRFASHKKWCYEACIKCKKQAANNYCQNCKNKIQSTHLSFSMGIQVADHYGSIWVTAYDQLAHKIFQDLDKTAAHYFQSLPSDKLSQQLQKYLYQSFKLRIITKKDEEGWIRHNASRMFEIKQQKQAKENIQKITQIILKNN